MAASKTESLPKVDRIAVDPAALANYTSEEDFLVLAVGLLREVASYTCVAACTLGPTPAWDRDQAAIDGNMVRLFKLLSAILDQTCQKRRETSAILARLAFETVVNVRYLVANFTPDLVDSYVRYSLRHERRLSDRIQANIATRGGTVLPIETRMLKSIERSARIAGISLDRIDLKDKAPWGGKHLYHKAQTVGLGDAYYDAMFGGTSHNVHGAWQDLYDCHLEVADDGGFIPNLEWRRPRPQVLFALGVIVLDRVHGFFGFIGGGDQVLGQVSDDLADLESRIRIADEGHEAYLSKRKSPQI